MHRLPTEGDTSIYKYPAVCATIDLFLVGGRPTKAVTKRGQNNPFRTNLLFEKETAKPMKSAWLHWFQVVSGNRQIGGAAGTGSCRAHGDREQSNAEVYESGVRERVVLRAHCTLLT